MSESVGHLSIVETSTDAASYAEADGVTSVTKELSRNVIDVTGMKDASGHRVKLMGVKDGKLSLDGHLSFTAVTFVVDEGLRKVIQRARDGGLIAARTKLDGSGGSYVTMASGLVESLKISANVDGSVTFSSTIQNNGAGWA